MDYARYSKDALDALPSGSPALRQRLAELSVDVQHELHAALTAKFAEIAAALNATGHALRELPRSKPGDIDHAQGETPHPFYLCCDTVISTGYRGTTVLDAPMADLQRWEQDWARARPKDAGGVPGAHAKSG